MSANSGSGRGSVVGGVVVGTVVVDVVVVDVVAVDAVVGLPLACGSDCSISDTADPEPAARSASVTIVGLPVQAASSARSGSNKVEARRRAALEAG